VPYIQTGPSADSISAPLWRVSIEIEGGGSGCKYAPPVVDVDLVAIAQVELVISYPAPTALEVAVSL
jgi:hypothetical protein